MARVMQQISMREFLLTSFANQVTTLEARPGSLFFPKKSPPSRFSKGPF